MSETPARDGMLDFALAAFKDSPNPVVSAHANKLADAFEAEVRAAVPSAPADADLRRQLASSERIRENADFHLGQEMARRQLAEKETARLRAVVARLRQMTDHWEQQLPEVIRTPAVVSAIRAALEAADEPSRMADEAQQPASTAPLAANLPLVQGRCPACNGASLFLGDGGYVTCSRIDCPEPDAASTALEQPETQADAHPPTVTWEIESPRRGTWASWGTNYDEHDWARQRFEDAIGHVPARRFRLVRATTTYTVEAEHLPAAVSQPVEARQADTAGEQQ